VVGAYDWTGSIKDDYEGVGKRVRKWKKGSKSQLRWLKGVENDSRQLEMMGWRQKQTIEKVRIFRTGSQGSWRTKEKLSRNFRS
jgi:hypothetical protein